MAEINPIMKTVSFGLELATNLQTYVEANEFPPHEIRDVSFDISSTASILKQLQEVIGTVDTPQTNLQVLKDEGRDEIEALAMKCEKVYDTIVTLVTKAGTAEWWGKMPANSEAARMMIVSSLRSCTKWGWLGPRIKRCNMQLRWLKLNLLLHLQLANLSRIQIR